MARRTSAGFFAGMFNVNDVDSATETYNKELIRISKEYSLLDEILKAGEKYGISDDVKAELQEAKKVADKNRAEIFSSDLNVLTGQFFHAIN
jgi:hypothetical protein